MNRINGILARILSCKSCLSCQKIFSSLFLRVSSRFFTFLRGLKRLMKYVVILADGMADRPMERLDGKTPLMVANTPSIDALCAKSLTPLCSRKGLRYPGQARFCRCSKPSCLQTTHRILWIGYLCLSRICRILSGG